MTEPVTVNVKLLDREFLVGCAPDEREGLLAAAAYLDSKMREVKGASRTVGYDRVAVLAALSLTHEMLQMRRGSEEQSKLLGDGIGVLRRKLEGALDAALK